MSECALINNNERLTAIVEKHHAASTIVEIKITDQKKIITPCLVALHLSGHLTLRVQRCFKMPRYALITTLVGTLKFAL